MVTWFNASDLDKRIDMNRFRNLVSATILLGALCVGSAHALVVDFEEFNNVGLINRFVDANIDYDLINSPTHILEGRSFGATGGITFSGGVLLQDPLDSTAMIINGDGGSIYYGTAFSPSTSIPTSNYVNTLTINITSDENINDISGSLVHGLNTNLDAPGILIDYVVNYYSDSFMAPLFSQNLLDVPFIDGAGVVSFGLNTNSLAGSLMGELINRVEITTSGYDFTSNDNDVLEWDFLLGSVNFDNAASPVPVPAALPLFISALLGGFVVARPKKKSGDHKLS
ncbi:MAG: hypothetical protein R8G33_01040 [Gammaproteobacteria bacterium]|nr:hypothetical protein [Gammaproteobacteria bacterium]